MTILDLMDSDGYVDLQVWSVDKCQIAARAKQWYHMNAHIEDGTAGREANAPCILFHYGNCVTGGGNLAQVERLVSGGRRT